LYEYNISFIYIVLSNYKIFLVDGRDLYKTNIKVKFHHSKTKSLCLDRDLTIYNFMQYSDGENGPLN